MLEKKQETFALEKVELFNFQKNKSEDFLLQLVLKLKNKPLLIDFSHLPLAKANKFINVFFGAAFVNDLYIKNIQNTIFFFGHKILITDESIQQLLLEIEKLLLHKGQKVGF